MSTFHKETQKKMCELEVKTFDHHFKIKIRMRAHIYTTHTHTLIDIEREPP